MLPKYTPKDIARFWAKVDRTDDCWLWRGFCLPKGYGTITIRTKNHYAHRMAYEIVKGTIPPGLLVCHTCDTPSCVNPEHLFLGTHRDNFADMISKGRSATGEKHGLAKHPERRPRGTTHGMAKLRDSDIHAIRTAHTTGITLTTIAAQYGVCIQTISNIVHRKKWRHVV